MTRDEAIAILENEKKCVNRANKNDYCNRDCYNCELVKTDTEILNALDMAIEALEQEPKTGHWIFTEHIVYCSECAEGFDRLYLNGYHYCPNCGAKLSQREEEHDGSD